MDLLFYYNGFLSMLGLDTTLDLEGYYFCGWGLVMQGEGLYCAVPYYIVLVCTAEQCTITSYCIVLHYAS